MPNRKTSALHRGRISKPGGAYFVTGCVAARQTALAARSAVDAVRIFWAECDTLADTDTLAATVMPDHFHWLFVLGSRLSLGRVLAKFKSTTNASLRDEGGEWQRDFSEHRLRASESIEDYGFYVFMNPYRAGLVSVEQPWAGWYCPRPERFRFTALLDSCGRAPRQWLDLPDDDRLHVRE